MAVRKAIVFLRQDNDIDQIVPILYKWLAMEDIYIHIVITTLPDYLKDYRINFLKQSKNLKVHYIEDFLSEKEQKKRHIESNILQTNKFQSLMNFYKISKKIFHLKALKDTSSISYPDPFFAKADFVEKMFDSVFERGDRGIVIFDWIMEVDFVNVVLAEAKRRGFPTVSLPHGDSPYYNLLESINDLNYDRMDSYRRSGAIFDYLAVPNWLCARRYSKYMGPDRLKILGSPRYNDEWLNIISRLVGEYETGSGDDKLSVAFFLRPLAQPVFWEEVIRAIKLVAQFPQVHLVVKHHTRKSSVMNLIKSYPELGSSKEDNLEIIFDDVHSGSLIKWADIILDLGTSITFEAVKRGKPVLAMEYMQANYLTISYYMKRCEMKCRDELYNTIQAFINDKGHKFYDEGERKRFIKEVIGDPDSNTLKGYVEFLDNCLKAPKPKSSFSRVI
jgi:hypothetical protein